MKKHSQVQLLRNIYIYILVPQGRRIHDLPEYRLDALALSYGGLLASKVVN